MPIGLSNASALLSALESPVSQQPTSAHGSNSFWHELVARVASEAGLDPELAVNVAAQESGFDPAALNRSSGAVGIMQLMPSTAAALGVNAHDAMANIMGGVRYLREQIQNFGDKAKALAAYNWGPRHVAEAVERWGADWLNHAPRETQNYVTSVLSKTGDNGSLASTANAMLSPNALTAESAPASSPHQVDPSLIAEALNLRSAMNAYLLSEILE